MPIPSQEPVAVFPFEGLLAIVGGGPVDHWELAALHRAGARFVGADGGADVIGRAGLIPDYIIGDLDSLADPEDWDERTRIVRITEQETTDFEKTLYSTAAPLTVALGVTGRRFDHTLAALHAVSIYARERAIILVDEQDVAVALTGPFSFAVEPGERVSIHPLTDVRFARSSGLDYALDGLTLAPGQRVGTSNSAPDGTFAVKPVEGHDGVWLLILDRRHLPALIVRLMAEG